MTANTRRILSFGIPVIAFAIVVNPYVLRQLWFDEALTVLNFACMESPTEIYHNYVIPNNQLLFTTVIHYWLKVAPSFVPLTLWLRLPSVFFAIALLGYASQRFRRICGTIPLCITLTALVFSPAFLTYATAVRGYMMSAFLVTLALGCAMDYSTVPNVKNALKYFLLSLCIAAVVPSNLAAMAAVVLFVMPFGKMDFWRKWCFYILPAIPLIAFFIVYLPIYRNFVGVVKLGEGWKDGFASLFSTYIAIVAIFAIPLLPAFFCFIRHVYRCRKRVVCFLRSSILLLPIPSAILFENAPFPRVYFPLFPLLAILFATYLRKMFLCFPTLDNRRVRQTGYVFLLVLTFAWGGVAWQSANLRMSLSYNSGGYLGDDFFYAYYLRPGHQPREIAEKLIELKVDKIYLSFLADPWSVIFYHTLHGGRASYLFDGPRGRIESISVGSAVVLNVDEKPEDVENRFDIKLKKTAQYPHCVIFVAGYK